MKNIRILVISLAAMLCLVSCTSELALDYVTTKSNCDPNSCLLNLTYTIQSTKVIFTVTQYNPDPINLSCTFQDLITAPWYYNQPFTPKNLSLTPAEANSDILTAQFTVSDLSDNLGSSCVYVGIYPPGQKVYTCRFKYSGILLYLDLWMDLTKINTFDTTATGVLFTELGSTVQSTKYGYDIWIPDPSFPYLIGRIEDGCNTWDNTINSLDTHLTVTGTEYLLNTFDLHNYLNGTINYNVLVLQNYAPGSKYLVSQYPAFSPFDTPADDYNCTDIGITYGSFLPDLSYCTDGCAISLVLYTSQQQIVLTTNGIYTAPSHLRI